MMKKHKQSSELALHNLDDIINDHIPSSTLKTIGRAFQHFTTEDLLEIGSTILKEDITPLFKNFKINATAIKGKGLHLFNYANHLTHTAKKEGFKNLLAEIKSDSRHLLNKTKTETSENYHQTIILIPETKKRLSEFVQNVSRDYSLLQSDEERGKYILKLSAYASIFLLAFQSGSNFPKASEQKNFIRKTLLPVLVVNGSLTLINRILEQVEKKICHNPEALGVTREIRKFIKIVNMGIGSGMTLQAIADGLTQTSMTTKGKVDSLVHSTVLALFSKEVPENPEQ